MGSDPDRRTDIVAPIAARSANVTNIGHIGYVCPCTLLKTHNTVGSSEVQARLALSNLKQVCPLANKFTSDARLSNFWITVHLASGGRPRRDSHGQRIL